MNAPLKLPAVRLDPGELFIGTRPTEVNTVLGSCVSVTIFHPRSRQGAINHGRRPEQTCAQPNTGLKVCRELGDYVDGSLEFMLAWFDRNGVSRKELEVKLFGGGMMFNLEKGKQSNIISVGKRNVDVAMQFIRKNHLHLTSSDVGGPWGRVIVFNTATGEVKLKRVRKTVTDMENLSNIGVDAGAGR
ncbi:MAG: chemotaxis protein CheD [Magnetococcales bacterium]|nr:chemotaxis protein CheD [Magnetococcales bacterium]